MLNRGDRAFADEMLVFAGSNSIELTRNICAHLDIEPAAGEVLRFSEGTLFVRVKENVRGGDVFVIQSTCAPGNDNLMELLLMMDAFKRASAKRITAVMPYYGYARQDRKVNPRVPISAKLVADLITTAGASRVLTMDLHSGQIQGFFNIPVDNLYSAPVLLRYLRRRLNNKKVTIVSPDAGGVPRARAFAKRLSASLAIMDKRRVEANVVEEMNIIGEVEGEVAVLLDDMVDTAGTLTMAAKALERAGASKIFACCAHPILSGSAIKKINDSPLQELVVSNSVPLTPESQGCKKIKVLSVASLIGEDIRRTHQERSVSSLFV